MVYAWENPGVPVDEVVNDVLRAFHHPAIRDHNVEIQREMFDTVQRWANETPYRHQLNSLLSSESVKAGKNHILKDKAVGSRGQDHAHSHGGLGHGKVAGSLWTQITSRDLSSMEGGDGNPEANYLSTSPAPPQATRPEGYGYGESQPPTHGEAASYLNSASQGGGGAYGGEAGSYDRPPLPPPPPGGHDHGHPGQHQQQQQPPPGEYWNQGPYPPQPPQQYGGDPQQYGGGPGYGGYGQPPPPPPPQYGQQPPPWGQYQQY